MDFVLYHLVNVYITNWKIIMLLMRNSPNFLLKFSIVMLNYQRVMFVAWGFMPSESQYHGENIELRSVK